MTASYQDKSVGNCLLVDDRPENLTALGSLLKDEPVRIFKARSGAEALELLLQNEFALALVDVQMPEMNGFELAELMRGTERTKHIPIIFVTAGNHQRDRVFKGYEAGAVDFLFKPLEPLIVRSKVRVFLELDRQNRLLKEREAELEKAVRTRDEFLSIASHELKTPLTSLSLQTQLLTRAVKKGRIDSLGAEKIDRMLGVVSRQTGHLTTLIDDLLDVARIANGKLTIEPAEMDLVSLVREVVDRFQEQIANAKSRVELELPAGLSGNWDPHRVEQVLVNLVSNACKYGEGSLIRISARRQGDMVEFSVADKGMGIPPARLPHIFDRFERAVEDSKISGLGLGLYITKQIISAHGGTIQVESQPGDGATFTVRLPQRA